MDFDTHLCTFAAAPHFSKHMQCKGVDFSQSQPPTHEMPGSFGVPRKAPTLQLQNTPNFQTVYILYSIYRPLILLINRTLMNHDES